MKTSSIIQTVFTIVLMLTTLLSFGQIPKHVFNEVTEEEFTPKNFIIKSKPIKERLGVYHFGESEGEWDLVLLSNGDSLIIQVWNGVWGKNFLTKRETWLRQCQTFNYVNVVGDKFYFGKHNGMFAEFKEGKKMMKTVLLFSDPIGDRIYGKDSAEVGFYNDLSTIENFYCFQTEKDYCKLSTSVQPENFFQGRSKQELKIMRNTIYAKYGLIFQSGGDMEKYFSKKEWYTPYQKDVSNCITEIEKQNIKIILRLEQK